MMFGPVYHAASFDNISTYWPLLNIHQLMINKGAESLPNKDAQTYKQLAVHKSPLRNTTTPRTTRRAWRMPTNYWRPIPTIQKQTPWRRSSSSPSTKRQRRWRWQSWPWWRARWRACSAGTPAAPSTSREKISWRPPSACKMRWGCSPIMWTSCARPQLCRSRWGTMWTILLQGLPSWSRNPIWSKIGWATPLPTIWYFPFNAERRLPLPFQVPAIAG